MVIVCPSCNSHFKLNNNRIRSDGSRVRCSKCKKIFKVFSTSQNNLKTRQITKDLSGLLENFKKALDEVFKSGKLMEVFWQKTQTNEISTSQSSQQITSDKIKAQLQNLVTLLQQNDLEAEDCIKSLKNDMIDPNHQFMINKIEDRINQLDFKTAYEHVIELANVLNISLSGGDNDG